MTGPSAHASRITASLDFDGEGKRSGELRIPFSSNRSGFGFVPIPVIMVRNGSGPTVLLMAGVHGDEYEGQIAITKFARAVGPQDISGRLIILPAVNYPAVVAGTRVSPIDGQNLNRCFPGDPDGSPTQMLAHYLEAELLPKADFAIDLHSGGNSLAHLPTSLMRDSPDAARREHMLGMVKAFGAPIALIKKGQPLEFGRLDRGAAGAAERCGVPMLASELGGGGWVDRGGLAIAENGIRRVLHHLGVLREPGVGTAPACRLMEVSGPDDFVYASTGGVYEPLVALGDSVEAGQPAAKIHFPEEPSRGEVVENFSAAGEVLCQRSYGRVQRADCLFHIAHAYTGEAGST